MADDDPIEDALLRWLPRDEVRDEAPLDVARAVGAKSPRDQIHMIRDLDEAIAACTQSIGGGPRRSRLRRPADDEMICYVPEGPRIERRMSHAALYADHVIVAGRRQREYRVEDVHAPITDLLDPPQSTWVPPPPRKRSPEAEELERILDEIEREMDDVLLEREREYEKSRAARRADAETDVDAECRELLRFAWAVRRPRQEGWLVLVDHGLLDNNNVTALGKHPEYRAALDARLPHPPQLAWRTTLNSYGLGRELGRNRVVTLPGSSAELDLVALTARFFHEVDYGTPLVGPAGWAAYPEPRSFTDADLPGWFDELVVALGSFTAQLDLHAASELRANGLRDSLRHWLQTDLNRVAMATLAGSPAHVELRAAARSLSAVADMTHQAIGAARAASFRERLKQAGLWGTGGLISGWLGTALAGGPPELMAGAALIGFAVSAATGGAAASPPPPDAPEPVLISLWEQRRTQALR